MSRSASFVFFATLTFACDNEPTKAQSLAKSASTTTSATPPPPTTPPPPPKALLVTVDDSAAMFDGDRVDFTAPDVKGRLATGLVGKNVEGETISIVAARETKMPKVAQVIAAVAGGKPKGIVVKTTKRDRSTTVDFEIALGAKRDGCAGVGWIAKDSSSSTWPAAGATATKYTKGMAGPDITRASDGLRKIVSACDAPNFFVGADEGVTWGLAADLAIAVLQPEDGGAPKARTIGVLAKATPGRKLDED